MDFSSVAVLVDGDNDSSALAGQILRKTASLGPRRSCRVYGTAQAITSWSDAPSFKPIVAGGAKNGADLLLSIEAMQFAMRDRIEAFAIASSDGDLSHAAHALREMGHHVLGLGEAKAPRGFRLACSHFVQLEAAKAVVAGDQLSVLDTNIRASLKKAGKQGIPVTRLNEIMQAEFGVKISEVKERRWPVYLKNRPQLYSITGDGKTARVHIATET